MNTIECLKSRRSIQKHKPDPIDHSIINSIISAASYSPSWKNTQITRYIAIEDASIIGKIVSDFTLTHNAEMISQTFAAKKYGLGTVMMGIFDGETETPKRKTVAELLQYR